MEQDKDWGKVGEMIVGLSRRKIKALVFLGGPLVTAVLLFQNCGGKFRSMTPEALDSALSQQDSLANLKIVNGAAHSCQILEGGDVQCWGSTFRGELGVGLEKNSLVYGPQRVPALSDVVDLTTGSGHTCALTKAGKVFCWGSNESGQLGDGTVVNRPQPTEVSGLAEVQQISARVNQTCVLLKLGKVQCWGQNNRGQLGNGELVNSSVPVSVTGLEGVTRVSAGGFHTCVILESGAVQCWGANQSGQLGNGKKVDSLTPVDVLELSSVKTVSLGYDSTCALTRSGTVSCWGANNIGQLGSLSMGKIASVIPAVIPGLLKVVDLVTANFHSCALLSSGGVRCWGYNYVNLLGNSTSISSWEPVVVKGVSRAVNIAVGQAHGCVLTENRETLCWGMNSMGQFGSGKTDTLLTPVKVSGITDNLLVDTGGNYSCSMTRSGKVRCWGMGQQGSLGNGEENAIASAPVDVLQVSSAEAISLNRSMACVVELGKVKCWGLNSFDSGSTPLLKTSIPVEISGMTTAQTVATGLNHFCALLKDGRVMCWGSNRMGQIGNAVDLSSSVPPAAVTEPQFVSELIGVTSLSAGDNHTCAVSSGKVYCWGSLDLGIVDGNFIGGLGDLQKSAMKSSPVVVDGINDAVKVYSKGKRTCVLLAAGTVKCWGINNASAVLGDGTNIHASTPVDVKNLSGVVSLALGDSQTCAILNTGKVRCWGFVQSGFVSGTSEGATSISPVESTHLVDVDNLALGSNHICAGLRSGSIQCWGVNRMGQLGHDPEAMGPQRVSSSP